MTWGCRVGAATFVLQQKKRLESALESDIYAQVSQMIEGMRKDGPTKLCKALKGARK